MKAQKCLQQRLWVSWKKRCKQNGVGLELTCDEAISDDEDVHNSARFVTNAYIALEGQDVWHEWSTLGWIFLPNKYWNDEFYSDYSVLLLVTGHC